MTQRVLVIGAGMAGLWTALALAPTGRQVTLLERDAPPPEGGADAAFDSWARRGVGHLRHSHAFLARLRLLIRNQHPELLDELLAAGCRDLGFEGGLTDIHKRSYSPESVDRDLAVLTSRRTTLELIMRRYVARQPNVVIRSGAFVKALQISADPVPVVIGLVIEDADGVHEFPADIVVDAAGRTSDAVEQLRAAGAAISEESEDCGILYFTRHYRLNPGVEEPPRGKDPLTGDLEYLKFGVFPADNGCFSITLCVPNVEEELRKNIVDPATFDAACALLPGLAPWTDSATATPISRVFGMGDLHSRWRDFAPNGKAAVLGFFPVGDSLVRSNPLFGRGCSFAAVGAHLLRDAIQMFEDPAARLEAYQRRIGAELGPYYKTMRDADRSAIRRARHALTPGYQPSLKSRLAKGFLEDGVAIAVRSDVDLFRAALRGFHMLEDPQAWLKRPKNLAKVLGYWARGKARNAEAYRPRGGPERAEMLAGLGLSPELDIQRVAEGLQSA
ncbi:FAD-dependent oxidoreductase [Phenylobacterium sp.]|uniref:FAD-dependent oxidoreductase n=1 Tax=Phenylobacterium sp. TaxID=1871053 RepID=UPI001211B3B4|nr:FAD-dependent oxidoreductase [Phenylobacterium sp.]THD61901.1 MAG: FAD-dependent oxidoreductase [Phenylobacterium sp.]